MLHNLLLYRLTIVTVIGVALTFALDVMGYVMPLFEADVSYLSYVIVVLFIVGQVSLFRRAWKVTSAINDIKAGARYRSDVKLDNRIAKLPIKNEHIADISGWLMYLGLLGTVVGFAVALQAQGMDDTQGVVSGIATAVGTTIVGGFLSLWLDLGRRILDTATLCLIEDIK